MSQILRINRPTLEYDDVTIGQMPSRFHRTPMDKYTTSFLVQLTQGLPRSRRLTAYSVFPLDNEIADLGLHHIHLLIRFNPHFSHLTTHRIPCTYFEVEKKTSYIDL